MTAGLYMQACEQLNIVMSALKLPALHYIEEVKPVQTQSQTLIVTHGRSLSIYYTMFFWVIKKVKVHNRGSVHADIITVARSGLFHPV